MTNSFNEDNQDSGGLNSPESNNSPLNGTDKIDLILTKMEGLVQGQAKLREDVTGLKNGQTDLRTDVTELKNGQTDLRTDVTELKNGQTDLRTDVTVLREEVVKINSGLTENNSKVDALTTKFDGFDYKLEGQDKKIEGQSAKIENSRYKVQYWLVGVIVAVIMFGLAVLGALPNIVENISQMFKVQAYENFLFFAGLRGHCCNLKSFSSKLVSTTQLRKLVLRL